MQILSKKVFAVNPDGDIIPSPVTTIVSIYYNNIKKIYVYEPYFIKTLDLVFNSLDNHDKLIKVVILWSI